MADYENEKIVGKNPEETFYNQTNVQPRLLNWVTQSPPIFPLIFWRNCSILFFWCLRCFNYFWRDCHSKQARCCCLHLHTFISKALRALSRASSQLVDVSVKLQVDASSFYVFSFYCCCNIFSLSSPKKGKQEKKKKPSFHSLSLFPSFLFFSLLWSFSLKVQKEGRRRRKKPFSYPLFLFFLETVTLFFPLTHLSKKPR